MSGTAVLKQETQPVADDPENLSTEELQNLTDDVEIPYRVEDATLMSPGVWNDIRWLQDEIEDAYERTDFEDGEKHNRALFLDHEDRDAAKWIGQVENLRMEEEDLVGDLIITDKETAIKLEFGAKFGISPKVTGRTDGKVMKTFQFDNFSVVVDPAVKTTFLNSQIFDNDEVELQEMQIHEPEFSDTADQEWNSPDLEDFTDSSWEDMSREEKMSVADHFIVGKSGFPGERFSDLALPVVEPDGTLNLNALANAKARAGQVEGVSGDEQEDINSIINGLANENFEDADFGEEDMGKHGDMSEHEEMASEDEERASESEENDVMGDKSTMSKEETEQDTPEEEQSVENEETTVDVEDLAQKVAEILEDDGDAEEEEVEEAEAEEEAAEEEEEDVENSDVEAADFDDFQSFAEEKMAENPDLSISDVAEMYEESQRDVEDKMEEMAQRFEEKIDSLQDELEEKEETLSEVKEKAENPQRVTQTTGEDVKSVKEKVEELSDDQLNKSIMKNWMDNAGIRMVTDE